MPRSRFHRAVVTGASSGIGAAIARELAARGCDLVLVARRGELLDQLAAELAQRHRVDARPLAADLTSEAGLRAVEQAVEDPAVDLLVNNAGFGTTGEFATLDRDREADEVRLNLLAPVRLTHAVLPHLLAGGHGGVLNVSSMAGLQPLPGAATYAATKSGLTTFTEALRGEVARHGVHVTVLLPGFTDVTGPGESRPGGIPGFLWLTRERVASDAVDAVERGRLVCVPGAQYKALGAVVGALPRSAVRAATARLRPLS